MESTIEALLTKIEHNTRRRPEITLEFKMNTNQKRFSIDPPISLHDGNYCMGLISLSVYNTIFNITEKNNQFTYYNSLTWKNFVIPPGAYEIKQINTVIQKTMEANGDTPADHKYPITIEANKSTQKSEITCETGYKIDFTVDKNIGRLLGFNRRILKESVSYTSDKVVDIMSIDKIHLNCDKVEGSILNGKPSSILYSFEIDKSPGYKIIKNPETILYKNITSDKIESLDFSVIDDDGNKVDFNNETITFTIQIIRK